MGRVSRKAVWGPVPLEDTLVSTGRRSRYHAASSVIHMNHAAWAEHILWGTGELEKIVWGTVAKE